MYISVAESIYGVYTVCIVHTYVYEALQHVFNGVNVRMLAYMYMQLRDYLSNCTCTYVCFL